MKIFLILGICGLFCSCLFTYDPPRGQIQVINYSNVGQIIYYSCTDMIGAEIDSFRNFYYKSIAGCELTIVNENVYIDKNSSKWFKIPFKKEYFACTCKDKHVRFFFISDSIFLNNPWDTIVKHQMYNRKLIFSEENLKKNNWVVVYE